jgi:hypothetical protein
MRKSTILVLLLLAGCAPLGRLLAPSPLTISPDGRTVTAGKETWTTPDEVLFYQRGDVLHVVSSSHGRAWDVAVPIGAGGRLDWPRDAPFEAVGGALKLRVGDATPEIAQLIESGQIHIHDDHYHLTHEFKDDDWQALYADRADGSPLTPVRRQVAATVLALLLDQRIPGAAPEATEKALRRMRSMIGKARRAVEGGTGARAIETIITYDVEIRDEGRTLDIGGQLFRAADPVRFAYCSGHFHVEDSGGRWAQPIELEGQPPGAFEWPSSIFFELRDGGTIAERTAPSRWRMLAEGGQIRFTRDHWHVTENYANPRLRFILQAMEDPKVAAPLRESARALAFELMRLRLDTGSDAEFEARLDSVDQVIERGAGELEKAIKSGPRPR